MEVKLSHPEKACLPKLFTPFGMETEVKPEQSPKVLSPIDTTLLGMVIEVKLEQP